MVIEILGGVGVAVSLLGSGYAFARSRNGIVKREQCHLAMSAVTAAIDRVHDRINGVESTVTDTRVIVGRIEGRLEQERRDDRRG